MVIFIRNNKYNRIVNKSNRYNFSKGGSWITMNRRYIKNIPQIKMTPNDPELRFDSFGYPYHVYKKTHIWDLNAEQLSYHPILTVPLITSLVIIISFIFYIFYMLYKGILIIDYFYPLYAFLGICSMIILFKLWRLIWAWLLTKNWFLKFWNHELIMGAYVTARVAIFIAIAFAMFLHIFLGSIFDFGFIGLHYNLTSFLRTQEINAIGTDFIKEYPMYALQIKNYLDVNFVEVYSYFNQRLPAAQEQLNQVLDQLIDRLKQADLEKAAKAAVDAMDAAEAEAKKKALESQKLKESVAVGFGLGFACISVYLVLRIVIDLILPKS